MAKFVGKIFRWLIESKGIQKDRAIYEALKQETELAPKSKKCAVRSIMFSLLMYGLIIVAFLGIYFLWKYNLEAVFFNIFITIVICVGLLYAIVACYIRSIINLIHQFRLNKKAHTWIALIMAIFPTILVLIAIILLVGMS